MSNLGFLAPWIQIFVPQPCFDKFFIDLDFFDGPCIKLTISKLLGFAIILGSVLVKVPQIIKLVNAKSAQGINIIGVTLELAAVTSSVVYGYKHQFPFSSYGDSMFLTIQTLVIAYCVFLYSGKPSTGLLYSAIFAAIMAFLLSPAAPAQLTTAMYASNVPNIVLARFFQIMTNFRSSSTGQLSAVTIFLLFAGAVARIFTSIQETGDQLMIMQFSASAICNGILAFQILWYWNADKVKSE